MIAHNDARTPCIDPEQTQNDNEDCENEAQKEIDLEKTRRELQELRKIESEITKEMNELTQAQ